MIEQITINNFQSHKKTELELSEGVNTIIGSSDSGKSAILRSLYWLIQNRPQGTGFASHWIKENDKLNGDCFVRLKTDKGKITRQRNNELNCYIDDETIYEKISGSIPEEIQKLLNISDVNIQKQMDSPFLLSESSGEVARFFNKIINLDLIDKILSLVDSKKRANNRDENSLKETINDLQEKIVDYNWIENAERIIDRLEIIKEKIKEAQKDKKNIQEMIEEYEDLKVELEEINHILENIELIKTLEKYVNEVNIKKNNIEQLKQLYNEYEVNEKNINVYEKIKGSEKYINKILELIDRNEEIEEKQIRLKRIKDSYIESDSSIKNWNIELEKLNEELPELCPLCGGNLK